MNARAGRYWFPSFLTIPYPKPKNCNVLCKMRWTIVIATLAAEAIHKRNMDRALIGMTSKSTSKREQTTDFSVRWLLNDISNYCTVQAWQFLSWERQQCVSFVSQLGMIRPFGDCRNTWGSLRCARDWYHSSAMTVRYLHLVGEKTVFWYCTCYVFDIMFYIECKVFIFCSKT